MPSNRASAHVFVDDLDRLELSEEDEHHLRRVLRITPGERVTASDGRGRWRSCRLGPDGLLDEGVSGTDDPPQPRIAIAFALTKGDRPEWVVQKLTEAGVDTIVPFTAARSVVRWDDKKAVRNVERLRRVAREAAMQSRRTWLPTVAAICTFADVAGDGAALAQPGGAPPSLDRPQIVVGPEGGFSGEELACGLPLVGLGPTTLRAETAAVAAGLVLCQLRAGVVRPA